MDRSRKKKIPEGWGQVKRWKAAKEWRRQPLHSLEREWQFIGRAIGLSVWGDHQTKGAA
jgi:hypothetical protein